MRLHLYKCIQCMAMTMTDNKLYEHNCQVLTDSRLKKKYNQTYI